MAKTDEYISEAYSELMKLSADERKRLEYEAREKAVRDYNTLMESAHSEGLKRGLREGLEEGRQEGLKRGRQEGLQQGLQQGVTQGLEQKLKEHTQKMLYRGMSPAEIADLLDEDPQLIASIANELQLEP